MAKMEYESEAQKKEKKKKLTDLEVMRRMFSVYADEANYRVSQLITSETESAALHNAFKRASKKSREEFEAAEDEQEGSGRLFSVTDKKDFRSLRAEVNRINAFLAESSSDVKIASYENRAFDAYKKHGLSFHNQVDNEFKNDGVRFRGYDQDRIKLALSIYRKIEETGASLIYGVNGKGGFGSDNIFNMIFDEIEGYTTDMPQSTVDRMEENAIASANAALTAFRHSDMYGFLKGSPKSSRKEQNVISSLAKSTNVKDFIARNPWIKERSW